MFYYGFFPDDPRIREHPRFWTCDECGRPVSYDYEEPHRCDREHWMQYQLVKASPYIMAFESNFRSWMNRPEGQFAQYLVDQGFYNEPLGVSHTDACPGCDSCRFAALRH